MCQLAYAFSDVYQERAHHIFLAVSDSIQRRCVVLVASPEGVDEEYRIGPGSAALSTLTTGTDVICVYKQKCVHYVRCEDSHDSFIKDRNGHLGRVTVFVVLGCKSV